MASRLALNLAMHPQNVPAHNPTPDALVYSNTADVAGSAINTLLSLPLKDSSFVGSRFTGDKSSGPSLATSSTGVPAFESGTSQRPPKMKTPETETATTDLPWNLRSFTAADCGAGSTLSYFALPGYEPTRGRGSRSRRGLLSKPSSRGSAPPQALTPTTSVTSQTSRLHIIPPQILEQAASHFLIRVIDEEFFPSLQGCGDWLKESLKKTGFDMSLLDSTLELEYCLYIRGRLEAFYAYLSREGEAIMFSQNQYFYPVLDNTHYHALQLKLAISTYSENDLHMHFCDTMGLTVHFIHPGLIEMVRRIIAYLPSLLKESSGLMIFPVAGTILHSILRRYRFGFRVDTGSFDELDKLKYQSLRELTLLICASLEGGSLHELWLLIVESFVPEPKCITSAKYYLANGEVMVLGK